MNLVYAVSKSNRFDTKESRAKKLLLQWSELYTKMLDMVDRGTNVTMTYTAKCAWAVAVMMHTGIRVGNEASAEGYICVNAYKDQCGLKVKTYGLTTLLAKHCKIKNIKGNKVVVLNFVGKKLEDQTFIITDKFLVFGAEVLLSDKQKEDTLLDIGHYDLTKFVKKRIGKNFTIKDIRTAKVNSMFINRAEKIINEGISFGNKNEAKKFAVKIIEDVAENIGHTKAVCRRSYVSKELLLSTIDRFQDSIDEES